jgi:large subunit ribosomal protein L24e
MKCSFCENLIKTGTGKIYAKKDGKILYFCTMKCEKNMLKLRRKAVKLKWTRTSQKKRQLKGEKEK